MKQKKKIRKKIKDLTHLGNMCDMKLIIPLQKCITQFDQRD